MTCPFRILKCPCGKYRKCLSGTQSGKVPELRFLLGLTTFVISSTVKFFKKHQ